jgi:hypothetical protein
MGVAVRHCPAMLPWSVFANESTPIYIAREKGILSSVLAGYFWGISGNVRSQYCKLK